MFVDARWDLRPKLAEDDELILFSKHDLKQKSSLNSAQNDVEKADDEDSSSNYAVDFSFDAERDAHLVAKDALKVFGNDKEIRKYWNQRFRLFKKLDQGILMDRGKESTFEEN